MCKNTKLTAVLFALLAAVFYSVNAPFSKVLLDRIEPALMAAFLYLGAGLGVGVMYLFAHKNEAEEEKLTREDLPYTIGMIVLDIAAPIFLMIGVNIGSASNASLLGNFEIVATTMIALYVFKEKVSLKLWTAILCITVSSIILSFEGSGSLQFSYGSLFVLLAACCWGMENNCTRKISEKSTYQIVVLKGIFSGAGSFLIALIMKERIPAVRYIVIAMFLGFVAYGLSIFMYVRAQRDLGAAKTSAYYAAAPFIGVFFAFLINGERPTLSYLIGMGFMITGTVFVVYDTMLKQHTHSHTHVIVHVHNGTIHSHVITHEHGHDHLAFDTKHKHHHGDYRYSERHRQDHIKDRKDKV